LLTFQTEWLLPVLLVESLFRRSRCRRRSGGSNEGHPLAAKLGGTQNWLGRSCPWFRFGK